MEAQTITLQFRAKRDSEGQYRVPAIKPHHVATPHAEQGTVHRLVLTARDPMVLIRNAFRNAGIDAYAVDASMPGVTVTPRGNGFMADVRIVVPFTVRTVRAA